MATTVAVMYLGQDRRARRPATRSSTSRGIRTRTLCSPRYRLHPGRRLPAPVVVQEADVSDTVPIGMSLSSAVPSGPPLDLPDGRSAAAGHGHRAHRRLPLPAVRREPARRRESDMSTVYDWGRLTREEIDAFAPTALTVIPVGTTEQHGPHLATGTDAFIAESVALAGRRGRDATGRRSCSPRRSRTARRTTTFPSAARSRSTSTRSSACCSTCSLRPQPRAARGSSSSTPTVAMRPPARPPSPRRRVSSGSSRRPCLIADLLAPDEVEGPVRGARRQLRDVASARARCRTACASIGWRRRRAAPRALAGEGSSSPSRDAGSSWTGSPTAPTRHRPSAGKVALDACVQRARACLRGGRRS